MGFIMYKQVNLLGKVISAHKSIALLIPEISKARDKAFSTNVKHTYYYL